jgi:phosphatidylglycerophosphate synthase
MTAADSELDAIVLARGPLARVRIAGLSARERCVRVARKVGATRVLVVETDEDPVAWRDRTSAPLLVIAADQLVHTPLVQPLVESIPNDGVAIAVDPGVKSSTPAYAGAFVATGAAADAAVAALGRGESDVAFVTNFTDTVRIPYAGIARHPIVTPAERRDAHRYLYKILIKPQDNAITRYLYRPVSFPLTRLLAWTPITPNQISYLVAALVAVGCWVTAHESMNMAILGTAIVLAASYLDCCDGEIARVKLLSSRYGAWIDTVIDELSSVGYMMAIGWHCHLYFGPRYFGDLGFDPWTATMALDLVTYGVSIYCIYYNIIVAVGSANSQDYVGRFEVVPGTRPNAVRLRPAATQAIATPRELPPVLKFLATYLPYIVRRDFISWCAMVFAVLHVTHVSFGVLSVGGAITVVIVTIDHVKLRRLRRRIVRGGQILESPSG